MELSKKPGSYKQVLNASKTTVAPGDTIEIDHYVSGFGNIDYKTAKIYFSSSSRIFDREKSKVTFGFKLDKKINKITWGGQETNLDTDALGSTIALSTGYGYGNDFTHMFSQYENSFPQIFFEVSLKDSSKKLKPPILWEIKIKDNLEPGDYYLTYILTYYNGLEWKNDKVELKIKVMSWFENSKYQSRISKLGVYIILITFLTFLLSIPSFINSIRELKTTNSTEKELIQSINKLSKKIKESNKIINKQIKTANKKDSVNAKTTAKNTSKKRKK